MVEIGEAVAGMWDKIGVKVEMKTVEWGVFAPMGRGEQKGLVGIGLDVPHGRPARAVAALQTTLHLEGRPAPARRPGQLPGRLPGDATRPTRRS